MRAARKARTGAGSRAEAAVSVARSDGPLHEFFELSLDMLCVSGLDGYFKRLNPAWERTLGWTREELLARPYMEFVHADDVERTRAAARRLVEGAEVLSFENRYRCRDGSYRWLLWKSLPVPEQGITYGVARDITDRKRAEEALAQARDTARESADQSAQLYRDVFELSPIGICQTTPDGRFLTVNRTLVRMLGYDAPQDLMARRVSELYAGAADRGPVVAQLERTGALSGVEMPWRRRDGSSIWVQLDATTVRAPDGTPRYFQAFIRDITQSRSLQEQFLQAQKMEAVGRLAGGVAHDFNNMLTAIIGNVELMLLDVPAGHRLHDDLRDVLAAARRAADLTRQLLTVSRKQVLQPTVLDLNVVTRELDGMLRRLIGEDVDLLTTPEEDLGYVKADRGGLEQVILNLVVNARDAMPKGGKVTISTGNVDLDEHYAAAHADVTPGRYVMLAVSDTGHGMDIETRRRIFEPFFTTKERGKGTGLGLSTVYGIVKQSGGHIWVYSEPGHGTTFKVYLPRADAATDTAGAPLPEGALQGSETILLVEDETEVRDLVRRALVRFGYTVLEAVGAAEAQDLCARHGGAIQLLLTDVVLPGLGGAELAAQITGRRPDCRVLYMSGYTDDAIAHQGVLAPGTWFIEKPFTPQALARKVREVLEG